MKKRKTRTVKKPVRKPVAKQAATKPAKSTGNSAEHKAFEEWKAGKPLLTLCKELGIHSGHTLTRKFKHMAGGEEQYQALRKSGAGGQKAFGGVRAAPRTREVIAQNDSAVKRMTASPAWKLDRVYAPALVRLKGANGEKGAPMAWRELKALVHVSPKGNRYVECRATERADLLLRVPVHTVAHAQAVHALRKAEIHAHKCRKCEAPMEERCATEGTARYLACSNWPTCTSTKYNEGAVPPKRRARLEAAISKEAGDVQYVVKRLRKYADSATARKIKHDEALIKRGVKAQHERKKSQAKKSKLLKRIAR